MNHSKKRLCIGMTAALLSGSVVAQFQFDPSQIPDLPPSKVGLDQVDNTSDANKPISTATQAALDGKSDEPHTHAYEPANANIQTHIASTANPHGVTAAQVGLGNVDNTADADKPVSTATQTALDGKVDDSQVLTDVPAGAVFTDTLTPNLSAALNGNNLEITDSVGTVVADLSSLAGGGSGSGDVVGPAIAEDDNIATFDNTTGKLIQDGGLTIAEVLSRGNHTGSQSATTITSGTMGDARIDGSLEEDEINHDNLSGFVANEHIDWTVDQGGTDIHPGNYTDTDTQLTEDQVEDFIGASIVGGTDIDATYDDGAGTITIDYTGSGGGVTDHGALTGLGDDDHTQYHTDARADTWLGTKDTDDVSEGATNLYYTEVRVSGNSDVSANTAHRILTNNPHSVTATQVGLGNVDNTSDANKPVSTATQSALDGKVDDSQVLTNVPAGALFTDTQLDETAVDAFVANNGFLTSISSLSEIGELCDGSVLDRHLSFDGSANPVCAITPIDTNASTACVGLESLRGNGTCVEPNSGGGSGSAAGNDTEIQWNDSGNFGADSDFTWNDASNTMAIGDAELSASGITFPTISATPSTLTIEAQGGSASADGADLVLRGGPGGIFGADSGDVVLETTGVSPGNLVSDGGTVIVRGTNDAITGGSVSIYSGSGTTNNGTVSIEGVTFPRATGLTNDVLTLTSPTTATWQPPSGGEANTYSNAGTGGVAITLTKSGVDLPFKSINSASSNAIQVTNDAVNNEILLDVIPGNIDHNSLQNYVAAEHYDWTQDQGANDIHPNNYVDTVLDEATVDGYANNNGYLTAEVDGSTTNEFQDLTLTTNTLSLTDSAVNIDLSPYLDDTTLDETAVDGFVANNGYLTAEVDGSTSNELQDLTLTTNTLSLTNSAVNIDLAPYLDDTNTNAQTICTGNEVLEGDGDCVATPVDTKAALTKSISIAEPIDTDDSTMFFTPVAITVVAVHSHIEGATNVVFNVNHAATRTGTGLDVFTSDITLTSTAGQTNNSGFNDATIPANSWVWFEITSVSGTPDLVHSTIQYTED